RVCRDGARRSVLKIVHGGPDTRANNALAKEPVTHARNACADSNIEVAARGCHNPGSPGRSAAAGHKIIGGGECCAAVGALANQPMTGDGVPLLSGAISNDVQVSGTIGADPERPRDLPTLKLEQIDLRPGATAIDAPTDHPRRD